MEFPISLYDLLATAPTTIVGLVAVLVLLLDALSVKLRPFTGWLGILGLLVAAGAALQAIDTNGEAFLGMVHTGGAASYFALVFAVSGILSLLLSQVYNRAQGIDHGEFNALVLFSVAGMMLMASAADLIIFFLGLELMSICFYVLAGFARARPTSNEAALKYFLLGAFATGFLLYGIALIYGATGTTALTGILEQGSLHSALFVTGLGLLAIGLAFKVAAVPFHMWVPDVYEGAPTTVSGFMSTGGKAAAFSAFLIVFTPAVIQRVDSLRDVLAVLAMLSMIVGNILAIAQTNVKRMLAYSSIAHAGYILVGVVAANEAGTNGVLFYLLAYTVMNVGAFGVLSIGETREGAHLTFQDYSGLASRRPALAALMALFMFSLTGIPPFAGFFGKYYVFAGAIEAGYTWLAILGVLMSVVSAYYYLRLVVLMYFSVEEKGMAPDIPRLSFAALVISAVATVGMGIFPSVVLNLTRLVF
jgi:NADH-quinone oxidoreductase subunit N